MKEKKRITPFTCNCIMNRKSTPIFLILLVIMRSTFIYQDWMHNLIKNKKFMLMNDKKKKMLLQMTPQRI